LLFLTEKKKFIHSTSNKHYKEMLHDGFFQTEY